MDRDEIRLIERVQDGDSAAFKEFVEKYQRRLFQFALELTGDWDDAEDISQQVFIKAYRGLVRFKGKAKVMSWLFRIAINTHIDEDRRRKSRGGWAVRSEDEDETQREPFVATAAEDNPERQTAAGQMGAHIQAALGTLAPQQRLVFILRHYHDLPLKEIAGILGVTLGTVKSQLFRAIRHLQKQLAFYRPELGLEESQ